jgi:MFS family permease
MNRMIAPTILSLSLLTVMSGAAIAPGLAKIAMAFPDSSPTSIKLILTVPAIFIIIFSMVSGWLCTRLSKRKVLFLGLAMYLIGGAGGGLTNSIGHLLLFRGLLGVGVGLIAPLSTGLIADFYSGDVRAKLMGYSTAASSLGGIISTLAAGFLAEVSWRFPFGVYLLGLFVMLLVFVFLPESSQKQENTSIDSKLPVSVYGWGAGAFFFMLAFYAAPMNLAIFIEEIGIGGSAVAGLAISLITGTGFLGGLVFGRVKKTTASFLPSLLFTLMAVGYFILSQSTNLAHVLLATATIGLGLGWSLPTIFVGATNAGGDGRGVQTMAVVSSLAYFGQFMSPVVFGVVGNIFGDSSIQFVFHVIATCFTILLLGVLLKRLLRMSDILKSA